MSELIPGDVYKQYMQSGLDWADKRGAADLLEGTLKNLEAQLTIEAKRQESCSMTEAKSIALSSNAYRDAMIEANTARTQANRAHVKYIATQALFEARRTAEASQRAAMRSAT